MLSSPHSIDNAFAGPTGPIVLSALAMMLCFSLISFDLLAPAKTIAATETEFHRKDNAVADRQRSVTNKSVIGYFSLGALGAVAWVLGRRRQVTVNAPVFLAMGSFIVVCYASILWSDNVPLTIRKLAVLTLFLSGAIGIVRWLGMRGFAYACALCAALSTLAGLLNELRMGLFAPWRETYRFAGVMNPNEQSLFCAVLCLVSIFFLLRTEDWRRSLGIAVLAVVGVLLILTKSRTGLGACAVAALTGAFIHARHSTKLLLGGGALVSAGLLMMVVAYSGGAGVLDVASLGRAEHAATLTGRLPLWNLLLGEAAERPLFGVGYGAFWHADNIESISETFYWFIPQAHSTYIDALLTLGALGLIAFVGLFVVGLLRAAHAYLQSGDSQYLFAASMVVLAIVHGATESKFLATGFPAFVLYGCLAELACGERVAQTDLAAQRQSFPRPRYSALAITPLAQRS